ncbi:MAG: DNA polymerase I [Ruminococcaceae bacterium]|nr:DNA polymerase I [Oscillospiraceae bacterium]
MKKFLILDGNSIINRAFYGIRPLSTKSGIPTNAIYGFLTIIKKHLDSLQPDYIACAFDVHQPTFRHLEYSEYKGNRKGMPDELRAQMPYAKRAAAALGFLVIECPGFEADDVIGTAAKMADDRGDIQTYILTGDRDSLQLIDNTTSVILAKTKEDIVFDEARFVEEYGIKPGQFVDVKALMGDSSDNIPGVAGIGEKTALKLISAAETLDKLYADETFFGQSASVCKKLADGREAAFMSRKLAEICRSAPIVSSDEIFASRDVDSAEFLNLCDELEFSGMAKRFGIDKSEMQEDTDTSAKIEKKIELISDLRALNSDRLAAIFLSENEFAAYDGGEMIYHCTDVSRDDVIEFIRNNSFVCHDYKGLLRLLHISGDSVSCVYDTMLAAYFLNPGKSKYLLSDTAKEYLSVECESVPDSAAAIYELYLETSKLLDEYGMADLMHDIEIPLSSVLAEMEERGFKINPDGIRKYSDMLLMNENALADSIWLQAGHQFNINSPKQLGEVLFEEIGLPAGKKTKKGYSTDAETLESLRPYHTIIADILLYRQIAKLRGTYGDSLINQADENGRIHTKLNQTGTATGRLASSDPNLQNIPVRMEIGRELRKYFITDDGYVLVDADYSQIELRILAALSKDEVMSKAFISGEDIHTSVASQVFGVDVDDVTPDMRRRAKAVNFGIVYGIGEFSLAKDLGVTRKVAKEYIENYLATYSNVDKYLKNTIEEAKREGYTTTKFGRRRNIPELKSTNRILRGFGERVAMNSPIQGTAADVIKIAMINVHRALKDEGIDAHLIMQVHDELIVEAKEDCADRAAEILVREMENAVKLTVPLVADCGVGTSWFEAK